MSEKIRNTVNFDWFSLTKIHAQLKKPGLSFPAEENYCLKALQKPPQVMVT